MNAQYSPIQIEEKWSKISESYGKMILGYFGNTPTDPDPEIMKIASKQSEDAIIFCTGSLYFCGEILNLN